MYVYVGLCMSNKVFWLENNQINLSVQDAVYCHVIKINKQTKT